MAAIFDASNVDKSPGSPSNNEKDQEYQNFTAKKASVPTDEETILNIAEMMHSSVDGGFASFFTCCTSTDTSQVELRQASTISNGPVYYVKGLRLRRWCSEEQERLPFELTEANIRGLVSQMIKHGVLTKARIKRMKGYLLEPISGEPSNELVAFNKEFYLWNKAKRRASKQ
jgi:hypothetical protein